MSGDLNVSGNLVFDNTSDREIHFNADKTSGSPGVKLNIVGNHSDGGAGGALSVSAGQAKTGGAEGGNLALSGGAGTGTSAGGNAQLTAGASGSALGGQVDVTGGATGSGTGGKAQLTGGASAAGGAGGQVNVTGGAAAAGAGGKVLITGGASTGAGAGGNIELVSGASSSGQSGNITLQVGKGTGPENGDIRIGSNGAVPARSILIGSNLQPYPTTIFAHRLPGKSVLNSPFTATLGMSGSVLIFQKPGPFDITLPPPTAFGLMFEVMQDSVGDNATVVRIDAGAGQLYGTWGSYPLVPGPLTGGSTGGVPLRYLEFTPTSMKGDRASFLCTGFYWTVRGFTQAPAGMNLA